MLKFNMMLSFLCMTMMQLSGNTMANPPPNETKSSKVTCIAGIGTGTLLAVGMYTLLEYAFLSSNQVPSYWCDTFSLTSANFPPNASLTSEATYCCSDNSDPIPFTADASIFYFSQSSSKHNLGDLLAMTASKAGCSSYPSCPTLSQNPANTSSPSYYKNFNPCKNRKQSIVSPRLSHIIALARDKQKRSKKLK